MPLVSDLEVYQAGELTVIGFDGREMLHDLNLAECRAEIAGLISEHGCRTMAFDLTSVRSMPGELLNFLASLRFRGVDVLLFNPSESTRSELVESGLDQLLRVHEVDVD